MDGKSIDSSDIDMLARKYFFSELETFLFSEHTDVFLF